MLFGLFQLFEWWYFRKYGASFIEQVSLNHISPWIGGSETNNESTTTTSVANNSQQSVPGNLNITDRGPCRLPHNGATQRIAGRSPNSLKFRQRTVRTVLFLERGRFVRYKF